MALSTSSVLSSSTLPVETGKNPAVRRSAGFHPSIWGDHFLSYTEDPKKLDAWSKRAEVLKEEVRRILINAKGSLEELDLLDAIQRLGVKYHFEKEIEEALHHLYVAETHASTDDLHYVSLRFRLLRQQGYNVSADVFRKFKDERGNFKASLSTDARGLLSLYEAAFLSIRGDDILDEAITFTKEQLKSAMTHDDAPLAKQIAHALEEEKGRNDVLLEFAKLDFNILQELHKKELRDLTKWWKDTDVAGKLPFIRDRILPS
ncbi:sesquiterpene synthase TPS2-like [Tasmannia lanceolata]|uniref:sesquiterpene synthase TPS2-like n=1 Tax=Tasmannia lanceolata TaxID=3420 RepID=UPI0040627D05